MTAGAGATFSFTYYTPGKLGLGLRWTYAEYDRDNDAYASDLRGALGIVDANYDMQDTFTLFSGGFQLGVSYLFDLSRAFQLEPYFFVGMNIFADPGERVLYQQQGTTYVYEKHPAASITTRA